MKINITRKARPATDKEINLDASKVIDKTKEIWGAAKRKTKAVAEAVKA